MRLVVVSLLAAVVPSFAGAAEIPQCTLTELKQNDKILVQDVVCAPGQGAPMGARPMRVVTALKGTTFTRTFEDGSTETVTYKDGETKVLDVSRPYSFVNSSRSTYHAVVTTIK